MTQNRHGIGSGELLTQHIFTSHHTEPSATMNILLLRQGIAYQSSVGNNGIMNLINFNPEHIQQ